MAAPPPTSPLPAGALSYGASGVDYARIDPLKLAAQRAALATAAQLDRHGFSEVGSSRGESAYVVDVGPFYLASIVECLGSKALVADAMAEITGKSAYAAIAQDTIAMAVNDLITVGATPLVVQAYWAAGGSDWFDDTARAEALVAGWKQACSQCGMSWGGGETPALAGIVEAGRVDLAAACTGIVSPKSRLSLGDHLGPGDAIVLLASSGIHANGLSLARKRRRAPAAGLPHRRLDQRSADLVRRGAACADRALSADHRGALSRRHPRPLRRQHHRPRLAQAHAPPGRSHLPDPPPARRSGGALVPPARGRHERARGVRHVQHGRGLCRVRSRPRTPTDAVEVSRKAGVDAWHAGSVEAGPRRLVIEPIGVEYSGSELGVRL